MIPTKNNNRKSTPTEHAIPFFAYLPTDLTQEVLKWCTEKNITPNSFTRVAILHLLAALKLKTCNNHPSIPEHFKDFTPQPLIKKGV